MKRRLGYAMLSAVVSILGVIVICAILNVLEINVNSEFYFVFMITVMGYLTDFFGKRKESKKQNTETDVSETRLKVIMVILGFIAGILLLVRSYHVLDDSFMNGDNMDDLLYTLFYFSIMIIVTEIIRIIYQYIKIKTSK